MAELEALYENKELNTRSGWRKLLPVNQAIKLGRVFGPSDWWINDGLISSYHATVKWDGNTLNVEERNDPRPTNRIFYQSRPEPNFNIPTGESFVIGNTVFVLHSDTGGMIEDRFDATITAETAASRAQLRQVPFETSATFLRALEQVPDVLRLANDEDMLFRNMIKVGLDALPYADAFAVVEIPPESTDMDKRVVVRDHQQRLSGRSEQFAASRRLAYRAIRQEGKSILHVFGERTENVTMRMDRQLPGTPWAICTPFKAGSGWGLYVDGRSPKEPLIINGQVRDKELTDYQKVIELVASLIESTRRAHQLQSRLTLYQQFIPRRLWNESTPEQLDEILKPRLTSVTVLFCDLRGSCIFAADGEAQLENTWHDLSAALDDMSSIITQEDGVVAGFQGDAVMAFWGWPDAQPDQIERAAKAALRIRSRFDKGGWWNELSCGIGIAHGKAIAGRLGAFDLAKVDVFGPVVNLSSRLESLTKKFGVRILVDEAVAEHFNARPNPRVRTRRLAKFVPAGMKTGLVMSELMPSAADTVQGNMKEPQRKSWDESVGWFLAGEWTAARNRFESFFSNELIAQILLEFMNKNGNVPPPGWKEQPEIVLDSKT